MLLRAAMFAWILGPLTCSGVHDDELSCEEAAARLRSCCAGFDPASVRCSVSVSCGGSPNPELNLDQSSCILGRSCEQLNADTDGTGSACARLSTSIETAMPIPPLCS
jgi:hypothetical protein